MNTLGAVAAARWLADRGLCCDTHWYVEIGMDAGDASTTFELNLYPLEWGFGFRHHDKVSVIRVTDEPFSGRDEHGLLATTPALDAIGAYLQTLEATRQLRLRRAHARIRTNLKPGPIRAWLMTM